MIDFEIDEIVEELPGEKGGHFRRERQREDLTQPEFPKTRKLN